MGKNQIFIISYHFVIFKWSSNSLLPLSPLIHMLSILSYEQNLTCLLRPPEGSWVASCVPFPEFLSHGQDRGLDWSPTLVGLEGGGGQFCSPSLQREPKNTFFWEFYLGNYEIISHYSDNGVFHIFTVYLAHQYGVHNILINREIN